MTTTQLGRNACQLCHFQIKSSRNFLGHVNGLNLTTSSPLFQVGAYCYAELGTMIRKSGADYAYIMETFGPFLAFVRLWIECMIVRPCSQAIVALTFSVYVMKPFFPECQPPEDAARMLAVCCICKYILLAYTCVYFFIITSVYVNGTSPL